MSKFQGNFSQKQGMVFYVKCRERQIDLDFKVMSTTVRIVHTKLLANLGPWRDIPSLIAQNGGASTRHVIRGI
jgi:hypothetical protein